MLVPPAQRRKAKIEVAQRATEGDRAEVDAFAEDRSTCFERTEPGRDLGELPFETVTPVPCLRPGHHFVARKHGGVHDAVGERLFDQNSKAFRTVAREQFAMAEY